MTTLFLLRLSSMVSREGMRKMVGVHCAPCSILPTLWRQSTGTKSAFSASTIFTAIAPQWFCYGFVYSKYVVHIIVMPLFFYCYDKEIGSLTEFEQRNEIEGILDIRYFFIFLHEFVVGFHRFF